MLIKKYFHQNGKKQFYIHISPLNERFRISVKKKKITLLYVKPLLINFIPEV